MDIASLQAFLAVAETASFSRAAERIFLTQPAVSKRIAALESELDTSLFDRIGRRVQLTEAGRALFARANQVLKDLDDIKRSITNIAGEVTGELRFATSHHIGLHRLPGTLKHFHGQYPQVRLDLRFMDSERACTAVARGELEMAIVTLPPSGSPTLKMESVWDDPLDIVVSPSHVLAGKTAVDVAQLLDYPAILPGPGTYTREIILKALGARRDRIQVGMNTNYLEVLKMLASIGLGWSALPRTMIDESLAVVQIKKMNLQRQLGIVTHSARTLSNAARAMMSLARENA
ncbi:MAG: LysR family transcriptional regulator [Candidatus Muproteobacteria bacterium RBG_16_62_13]|uniref:LysR family transcriptional regulator n=1 Tax=Candidatus Muproteobacteria bacterium RBG_16_62_13 TaxID=1817756 RepID=A0A1F6SZX3_9PROT|nr:MAG: LysR family transcriptional regulator [Candidatus Muproteobacteria bacterium RBG_16_62_13]